MLLDERCLPAVLIPGQPLRRWLPSLQEVTGGSQAISAKASDVDFPTYYKVPCSLGSRIDINQHVSDAFLLHLCCEMAYDGHCTFPTCWTISMLVVQESQLARDNDAEAAQLAAELPQKHQPLVNNTRYATPANMQMRQLMRRFLLVYWRSPAYNVRGSFQAEQRMSLQICSKFS
jgi:hypothetical protein